MFYYKLLYIFRKINFEMGSYRIILKKEFVAVKYRKFKNNI